MKLIHYLSGLPRSGSTLLANVLDQNPQFHVTGTSPLPGLLRSAIQFWSNSPEVQSQIDAEKDVYFARFKNVLRALMTSWYQHRNEKVIFDKSRAWTVNWMLVNKIWAGSENAPKIILCIRDLRDIFSSIEKESSKTLFYGDQLPLTMDGRANAVFGPSGVVGGPLFGIQDMDMRGLLAQNQVFVWRFEQFVENPKRIMLQLYEFMSEKPFEHDFDNIQRTSTHEDDSVYRYTYPHRGEGKVRTTGIGEWRNTIHASIAETIRNRFRWFYDLFY